MKTIKESILEHIIYFKLRIIIFFFLIEIVHTEIAEVYNVNGEWYHLQIDNNYYGIMQNGQTYGNFDINNNTDITVKIEAIQYTSVSPDGNIICYLRKDTPCDNIFSIEKNEKQCLGTYSQTKKI